MKRSSLALVIILGIMAALSSCATTGLADFGAEMGIQDNPIPGGDPIRVPYTSTVKYFGYVQPGEEADEVVDSRKVYYLYLWIPLASPELGIRMLSPVGDLVSPAEGDIVAAGYDDKLAADPESFFDTWINLERAESILDPADIESNFSSTNWVQLASNDDSSEMPTQPSGNNYNSLLRIETGDAPLVRGLYRIGFTTYKPGEVTGSFYAEVGAPIELPGVVIAKTIDEVIAAAE